MWVWNNHTKVLSSHNCSVTKTWCCADTRIIPERVSWVIERFFEDRLGGSWIQQAGHWLSDIVTITLNKCTYSAMYLCRETTSCLLLTQCSVIICLNWRVVTYFRCELEVVVEWVAWFSVYPDLGYCAICQPQEEWMSEINRPRPLHWAPLLIIFRSLYCSALYHNRYSPCH